MELLIDSFINEALSAPSLFVDLAKVELYISESYRTRALIELIQNADDCGATNFIAVQSGKDIIVANNGRDFDENDILALCRSGSSTKQRGGGTIGYRGIGFKSTVGICQEIEVYSGGYAFLFSRELTKKAIDTMEDVPLIRVPHRVTQCYSFPPEFLDFKTRFIFKDTNFRVVNEEISKLESSSCIFLKNINSITLITDSFDKKIHIKSSDSKKTVISEGAQEHWTVLDDQKHESSCKIAMKMNGYEIEAARKDEALIHAFLPTRESPGAALKFNGDFSTDPSRKFVDFDKRSEDSFISCCRILAFSIKSAIINRSHIGIFRVFDCNGFENRKKLRDTLIDALDHRLYFSGSSSQIDNIRTCPEWLSYTDYYNLKTKKTLISQEVIETFPELSNFCNWIGVKTFTSSEVLLDCNFESLSLYGVMSVVGNYAKKNRFTLEKVQLRELSNLKIIPIDGELVTAKSMIQSEIELPQSTLDLIKQFEFESDIKSLYKSLGILSKTNTSKFDFQKRAEPKSANGPTLKSVNVKKWRSAELNLKEYLAQFDSVFKVTDVSKAHVGYDLKVQLKSGKILHIEVKSVKSLQSDFEITNNEFAVASDLGDSYFIGLVIETESEFDVRLIQNPIQNLSFEKRVKVTSWVCDTYNSKVKSIKEIL
ncbi:DUF3883 domain-containing protein [Psychrobium sp. 1_MG-2023]|uniref:DUF3883 domain-containing protein n=1 Tax=Psychrobium sp. 1_MG-2023 TaxID=3062624 RepID=UPI000C31CD48|nr:DUF3883 domain-containing protein [Psychrobium sp. 1_MG-2023]MDP2561744.1 DUF3883 domain-containing protein [Psychrobium sp. 1_MG-2023]PKF59767.1 hypothetical protein CW748_00790 [Alteromonadales bacterium alter-6D02]